MLLGKFFEEFRHLGSYSRAAAGEGVVEVEENVFRH
jgi:hypothetical protein